MALDYASLIDRVRVEAGSPSSAEIADSVIQQYIDEALTLVNRYIPRWAVGSLTTVKDQQAYSLDSVVKDVLFCDWRGTTSLEDVFGSGFDVLPKTFYFDPETEVWDKFVRMRQRLESEKSYGYIYNEEDNELWLIPAPDSAGSTVYYIYAEDWTPATLPEKYAHYIVRYATAQVLKVLSRKRRKDAAIVHAGNIVPWNQADQLLKDAQKLEREVIQDLIAEERRQLLF